MLAYLHAMDGGGVMGGAVCLLKMRIDVQSTGEENAQPEDIYILFKQEGRERGKYNCKTLLFHQGYFKNTFTIVERVEEK